jgi:hypothetical protein
MLIGEQEARAGGLPAIAVKGGYKPGSGEPPYDYIFQIYMEPTNTILAGDSVTFDSLIGVTPNNFPKHGDVGSTTSEPNNPPAVIWTPAISYPTNTTFPYASNLTWSFFGNTPISATPSTGEVYLGQFVVETTVNFTSPPYANGAIIDYSWIINGQTSTGMSQFPIFNLLIPEPSSAVLLLVGVGSLPLFVIRQRWHQRRSQQRLAA